MMYVISVLMMMFFSSCSTTTPKYNPTPEEAKECQDDCSSASEVYFGVDDGGQCVCSPRHVRDFR